MHVVLLSQHCSSLGSRATVFKKSPFRARVISHLLDRNDQALHDDFAGLVHLSHNVHAWLWEFVSQFKPDTNCFLLSAMQRLSLFSKIALWDTGGYRGSHHVITLICEPANRELRHTADMKNSYALHQLRLLYLLTHFYHPSTAKVLDCFHDDVPIGAIKHIKISQASLQC